MNGSKLHFRTIGKGRQKIRRFACKESFDNEIFSLYLEDWRQEEFSFFFFFKKEINEICMKVDWKLKVSGIRIQIYIEIRIF